MKTVILMRHAKSSWKDRHLDDHDRPLKKRGREAAPVMARWLAERGLRPDVILCSTSRRTRETLEGMRTETPMLPEARFARSLYETGSAALLDALKALPGSCGTVLVIGHQPGLGELLRLFTVRVRAPGLKQAFEKFPTAAIAVLEADVGTWAQLGPEMAELVAFAAPRELAE